MATNKKEDLVEIRPRAMKKVLIKIVGDTPLITHAWDEKAKRMMLEAQTKKNKTKARDLRDPFADFINSMYWITEKPEPTEEAFLKAIENGAKFGFPMSGIKKAAVAAPQRQLWTTDQVSVRGSMFLLSEYGDLGEIISDTPIKREDMVRLQGKTSDLRYRAEFRNWSINLILEYNENGKYSLEQLINFIDAGGLSCGIGEWRPEKNGDFGRYHVEAL